MAQHIVITEALAQAIAELADTAQHLWDKGWAERNGGNISVEVTEALPSVARGRHQEPFRQLAVPQPELAGRSFLITGAGTRMRDVAKKPAANCCVLRVSDQLDGYTIVWGGEMPDFRPTSELASHLAVHSLLLRAGRPQRAFLHTHPDELIALTHIAAYRDEAVLNNLLWSMHPEVKIVIPEGVGLAPYRPPGSEALAEVTLAALAEHRVAVWEKHGCVAVGAGPAEAFDLIDAVNKAARIFCLCTGAGFEAEGLTRDQVAELARLFPADLPAGRQAGPGQR